jgi:NAD(P)-dependent dehydrogenase (short-subunit alcohol dehydrogenase family)
MVPFPDGKGRPRVPEGERRRRHGQHRRRQRPRGRQAAARTSSRRSSFTPALAHELAGDNIPANCLAPGLIDTERDPNVPLPQHHRVRRTLLGRLGSSEEIAAAVCFLAGPRARYITGQTLHLNGCVFLP